jgi:formamidopyrimidine-DNA glycosylase
MPEGPELKYLGEICKKYLIGHEIDKIKSNSKTVLKLPKKSKVIDVMTKGKLLILICEDYYFHIHFGLTGWLVFEDADYPRYEITFKKENKEIMAYIDDSRRFSKLKFLDEDAHQKVLDKLGVDILTHQFTLDFFSECIKNVNKKIVVFLLEQDIFCGIGNYIKNESLYISKIDPHRNTSDLDDDEIKALYNAIIFVAYSNTLELIKENKELKVDKNFMKLIKSIKTEVPYKYKVYQQEKDPHGNKVIHAEIAGRKSFYVKEIQK